MEPQHRPELAPEASGEDGPRVMRRALAEVVQQATGGALQGVVMEDEPDEGASAHEKFHRLEQEHLVVAYLILYPLGCNTDGLRVEEGMLLRDLVRGRHPRIVAIAERGVLAEGDSRVELLDAGRRTRYTRGLLEAATNVRLGIDLEDIPGIVAKEARYVAFDGGFAVPH